MGVCKSLGGRDRGREAGLGRPKHLNGAEACAGGTSIVVVVVVRPAHDFACLPAAGKTLYGDPRFLGEVGKVKLNRRFESSWEGSSDGQCMPEMTLARHTTLNMSKLVVSTA